MPERADDASDGSSAAATSVADSAMSVAIDASGVVDRTCASLIFDDGADERGEEY